MEYRFRKRKGVHRMRDRRLKIAWKRHNDENGEYPVYVSENEWPEKLAEKKAMAANTVFREAFHWTVPASTISSP